jgi:hypothetical protein
MGKKTSSTPRPGIDELIAWEQGDLPDEQEYDLFERLVLSGMIFSLQGCYGRQAHALGLM